MGDGKAHQAGKRSSILYLLSTIFYYPHRLVLGILGVVHIEAHWEAVGQAHGEVFGAIRPAATMVQVARLIDPRMLVEIEADALVPDAG